MGIPSRFLMVDPFMTADIFITGGTPVPQKVQVLM
jgi:hypothetical protein